MAPGRRDWTPARCLPRSSRAAWPRRWRRAARDRSRPRPPGQAHRARPDRPGPGRHPRLGRRPAVGHHPGLARRPGRGPASGSGLTRPRPGSPPGSLPARGSAPGSGPPAPGPPSAPGPLPAGTPRSVRTLASRTTRTSRTRSSVARNSPAAGQRPAVVRGRGRRPDYASRRPASSRPGRQRPAQAGAASRSRRRGTSGLEPVSAALITLILTSLDPNDCSIVSLFYQTFVRSNASTVPSYRTGPDTLTNRRTDV